jgi:hypothetical protein
MGTSTAMLEKHYGHTGNIASTAELTKDGQFESGKKAGAASSSGSKTIYYELAP